MFLSDPPELDLALRTLILGPVALVWISFVVRLIGLRAFSKMAAFDFVVTVATGSLLAQAAAATSWPAFVQSNGAVLALLAAQAAIAKLRQSDENFRDAAENEPLLLMRNGEFKREAMAKARISEDDIWAKLREANVLSLDDVRGVVLETTGDISVLHGEELDTQLLHDVRGSGNRSG